MTENTDKPKKLFVAKTNGKPPIPAEEYFAVHGGRMTTHDELRDKIDELAFHLWGPESSSLYHTKKSIRELVETHSNQKVREALTKILRYSIEIQGADVERTGKGRFNAVPCEAIQAELATLSLEKGGGDA